MRSDKDSTSMLEEKLSGYLTGVGRAPCSVHSKVKGQVYTPYSFGPPTSSHFKLRDRRTELATDVLKSSVNQGFQVTASNFGNSRIFCYASTGYNLFRTLVMNESEYSDKV